MAELETAVAAWIARYGGEEAQWERCDEGPALAEVASRIGSVPRAFLDDAVDIRALVADAGLGGRLAALGWWREPAARRAMGVGLWLYGSQQVLAPFSPVLTAERAVGAIDALAMRLAPAADPRTWIASADRREEAARLALMGAGWLPAGEDTARARARFDGLDSLAHDALLGEVLERERHRAAIAAKLQDARAKEAAARYTRE